MNYIVEISDLLRAQKSLELLHKKLSPYLGCHLLWQNGQFCSGDKISKDTGEGEMT